MGENREAREAFVTLATNDTYALGCLVLGNSLRRVGTTRQLVVMVSEGVSESMRQQLAGLFNQTISVNVLDSSDTCNLELLGRPDLSVTFTKFHCWRLTQFQKCVFLDADTLVIRNIDDLFDREELSAAPDAGWPDCFNSGVFVYVPSDETYRNLLALAVTSGSFDGGDQGLLNLFFKSWATEDIKKHLPFTYNVVSQAFYSYLPAFKQFYDDIKVVHFIGAVKPWHHSYNTASRTVTPLPNTGHSQEFLQFWWDIFMDKVQQSLDPQLNPSIQQKHTFPYPSTQQPSPPPAHDRSSPPYPEPDHWPPPADHHGHSNTTGSPTTSYNILYPYVPPNVDDDSSESQSFSSQDTPSSTVVDIPIVYREYKPLESHYPEEPLSSVNPEMPPSVHYSATDQLTPQVNAHTDGDTASRNPKSGDQLCGEAVSDGGSIAEGAGEQLEPKQGGVGVTVVNPDINLDPGHVVTGTDDGESEDSTSKGGIVGDLANITLQSAEGSTKKDDRERKLQWEQGQADYMGVDRFDNIKARLDEKISQPSSKTSLESEEKKEESKVRSDVPGTPLSTAAATTDVVLPSTESNVTLPDSVVPLSSLLADVTSSTLSESKPFSETVVAGDQAGSISVSLDQTESRAIRSQEVSPIVDYNGSGTVSAAATLPAETSQSGQPSESASLGVEGIVLASEASATINKTIEDVNPSSVAVLPSPNASLEAVIPSLKDPSPMIEPVLPSPDASLEAVIPSLKDPSPLIEPVLPSPDASLEAVIPSLKDPSPLIEPVLPSPDASLEAVIPSLKDPSPLIEPVLPSPDASLEAVIPSLKDPSPLIEPVLPSPDASLEAVIPSLKDPSPLIEPVLPSPDASLEAVIPSLKDPSPMIEPVLPSPDASLEAVIPSLKDPSPLIEPVLPSPDASLEAVIPILKDPSPMIEAVLPSPNASLEAVIPILKDPSPMIEAVLPSPNASLEAVIPSLKDPSPMIEAVLPSPNASLEAVLPSPNASVEAVFPNPEALVPAVDAVVLSPPKPSPPPVESKPSLKASSAVPTKVLGAAPPAATKPVPSTDVEAPQAAPKHKPSPFSFKQQENPPAPTAPSPKPWSPAQPTSPAAKPVATPPSPGVKVPPSVAPKPMSPSGAVPKPSFITSQAAKFDKPASPGAAPPKPAGVGLLASRFETPKAPVGKLAVGVGAKSPTGPLSPEAVASSSPKPTSPTSPSKPAGTNRDEMFARFGVRLPPPKK